MKKTSIALCAVLFGALVVSNVFAEENLVASNEAAANETGAVVETTTETTASDATETTTGDVATEATTGDVAAEATTGDVAAEATTGDVAAEATTGDVAAEATTGDVAAEATTGDVAAEAEKSINDELHAILDKYFEDNASKFNTTKDKKDFFDTVKANINKAAENAREAQKEAFEILKGALETYEIK